MNSSIKLEVTATKDYCGGANPAEEMLEELKKPQPYSGTLYLHNNKARQDDGIEIVFVDGLATADGLNNGFYYMFTEKKIDIDKIQEDQESLEKMAIEGIDIGCLFGESQRSVFEFEVDDKTKIITQQMHIRCNPCLPPAP